MTTETPTLNPSMLISFSAQNTRSFRDRTEFTLQATSIAEKGYVREIPWRENGRLEKVLPAAAIFGANASGKSNLLKAMSDMRSFVLESFIHPNRSGLIPRKPFLLDPQTAKEPTRFEVEVIIAGVLHQYGFEVDDKQVIKEWAYRYPKGRAGLLFHRTEDGVKFGAVDRRHSRMTEDVLRPNALFLSAAALTNHPSLSPIHKWFEENLLLAAGDSGQTLSAKMLTQESTSARITNLLQAADLGLVGAQKQEKVPLLVDQLRRYSQQTQNFEPESGADINLPFADLGVLMTHRGVGDHKMELDPEDESSGTQALFGLAGHVLNALESGTVLLADQIDASLHPNLVKQLVLLFQSPESNPGHAQLVFTSNAVTLMDDSAENRTLGRDQIWFTEKSNEGVSWLYSLHDYQPRKHVAVRSNYLRGRYGAVPILFELASGVAEPN